MSATHCGKVCAGLALPFPAHKAAPAGSATKPSVMWMIPFVAWMSGRTMPARPTMVWPAVQQVSKALGEKGCTLAVLPHQAQHPTKASLLNSCVSLSANNRTAAQTIPPDCALTGSCWPSAAVTLPADARSEVVSRWGTMEASTKPRRKVGSCRQGEEQLSLPNATASAIGSAANLEHSLNCPAVICMQLILINNWRTPLTVSTHLQLVAGHCAAEHSSVERLVAGRKDCGAAGQGQAGVECTCTLRPARVAPKGTALCRT